MSEYTIIIFNTSALSQYAPFSNPILTQSKLVTFSIDSVIALKFVRKKFWTLLSVPSDSYSPLTQSKRKFIRRELSIIWQLFDADSEKLAGRIFKLPIKRFLRSLKRQNIEKLSENVLNHAGRVPGKEVSACRPSAHHRRCCLWRRRLEPVVRRCCHWWCCGELGLHAGGEPDSVFSDG